MNREIGSALWWSAVTLAIYAASRWAYSRWRCWWLSPLLVTWVLCGLLLGISQEPYHRYIHGTQWLVQLLAPATVAFALPIYERRDLIRRHGRILAAGILVGTGLSVGISWGFASAFELPPAYRASLLPRSITTPFAMEISQRLGGIPELTASLTAVTGLFGAATGELLLLRLPMLRSSLARGAFFGMGAHGAGVAKSMELGDEEGAVAGLTMVLTGLFNLILATLLTR